MSATAPLVSTTSRGGSSFPSTDPNQNPNPDPFSNGPSVYLYGFLATLVLIFLVSMGVAWKGYHTRRVLRARIDEAIARGVLIPGYDPSNPHLPLFPPTTPGSRWRNAQVMVRPILYEEWTAERGDVEDGEGKWDIKPTGLDVLRPYDPSPLAPHHPSSHAHSLLNQLLDPLRQYWFVQPPERVDADPLQGRRPATTTGARGSIGHGGIGRDRERRRESSRDRLNRLEEEQVEQKKMEESMGLWGVREVVASVFIVMPDRGHPAWGAGVGGAGRGGAGGGTAGAGVGGGVGAPGAPGVASGSRPSSWQQQQRHSVAGGSRPISSSTTPPHTHTTSNHGHPTSNSISSTAVLEAERRGELPELVLGVVLLGLREEINGEVAEVVEGVEVEEGVAKAPVVPVVPVGNGASGKGKEPAVTTLL